MLAMPGMRAFALALQPGSEGVSCNAHGVYAGGVPLLHSPSAGSPYWTARPAAELNKELTARYRLPLDIASKAGGLALIAAALNRGDLAMAAIAAVQMEFPDPPPLTKGPESSNEIWRRAQELARSRLLKFWDPAKHPRSGVPPNPGWFAPAAGDSESVEDVPAAPPPSPSWLELVADEEPGPHEPIPNVEIGHSAKPWGPLPVEGEGGENAPRGILELPLPVESSGASGPGAAPKPPAPVEAQPNLPLPEGSASPAAPSASPPNPPALGAAPRFWTPPDPKSKLPFMGETEPQLAPYKEGGPTSGIFKGGGLTIELESGYDGPALNMPAGSPGFDGYTLSHVEGHAAALMRQLGIQEAWLRINNPEVCDSCQALLKKMLPPGAVLHIILPDGTELPPFVGVTP